MELARKFDRQPGADLIKSVPKEESAMQSKKDRRREDHPIAAPHRPLIPEEYVL